MRRNHGYRCAMVAAALCACLGAEGAGFGSQQVDGAQGGVADLAPVRTPKLKWKLPLPRILSHQSVQTVLGPRGKFLYFTAGGALYKVDGEEGRIVWRQQANFIGHPSIRDGVLYAAGASWLKAYDLSQSPPALRWTCDVGATFLSASKYQHAHRLGPTLTKTRVLAGTGSGRTRNTKLYAVARKSGKIAWTFDLGAVSNSLVAADEAGGLAFAVGAGGMLFALDLESGKKTWQAKVAETPDVSGPSCGGGVVYCGGAVELAALECASGKVRWRVKRKTPGRGRRGPGHSAILTPDSLVVNTGPAIEAYDRKTGAFKWSYKAAGEGRGFLAAARGVLYIPDFSSRGFVHAVDLKTSAKLWAFQVPGVVHKCDYVGLGNGRLYFSTLGRSLYCLENDEP